MIVKVRCKLEEGGISTQPRRVFIGELKPVPKDMPENVKENFIRIRGKQLLLERHQSILKTVEDPHLEDFLVPLNRVDWITILPEDIDLHSLTYEVVGARIVCKTTKQKIPLGEEGT